MQRYAHILPLGKTPAVFLFALPNVKLPAWFMEHRWGCQGSLHHDESFRWPSAARADRKRLGPYQIKMSAAERVIMGVLYDVPQFDSYEEARLLMARLITLRPRVVQNLLKKCTSVKVKRVFMLLAENCEHAWGKKVDRSRADSILTPPREAGTKLWGFQRERASPLRYFNWRRG
ncbi:MAG: hypothetical protein HW419_457 [Deltaproteobacteria bacterium]|nr:hypothetical protein [Deltaproteobacteria bacterium]